jgi:hypothetical protein
LVLKGRAFAPLKNAVVRFQWLEILDTSVGLLVS